MFRLRNLVSVVEYPSVENNFTAKIYLNDDPAGGAAWYEFSLSWVTSGGLSVGDVASSAWVPSAPAAVGAAFVAAGAVVGLSVLALAASSAPVVSTGGFFERFFGKLRGVLPDAFKKWLENLIASRAQAWRWMRRVGLLFCRPNPRFWFMWFRFCC